MTRIPFTMAALTLAAGLLPLAAQTPLYNDGPQFGGSKVFSEGINPLGNPARFGQASPGWYFTVIDGDQRAQNNQSLLAATTSTDPVAVGNALTQLGNAPWALRTRAYGLEGVRGSANFGLSREEYHSLIAYPDLANLGSTGALQVNQTWLDGRYTSVDRLNVGGGSLTSGTAVGYNLRLENWAMGRITPYLNQLPGTFGSVPFHYASANDLVMAYNTTTVKSFNYALDLGFTTELAQGLRIGAMVDQLNHKLLWDVDLKPQVRAAIQIDLGPNTQVALESDVNGVERMPFPVKQQSASASLKYQVSPAVVFMVGGERRTIDKAAVNRFGVTLQMRTPLLMLSVGFQAGNDRPLKGAALMVN